MPRVSLCLLPFFCACIEGQKLDSDAPYPAAPAQGDDGDAGADNGDADGTGLDGGDGGGDGVSTGGTVVESGSVEGACDPEAPSPATLRCTVDDTADPGVFRAVCEHSGVALFDCIDYGVDAAVDLEAQTVAISYESTSAPTCDTECAWTFRYALLLEAGGTWTVTAADDTTTVRFP